MQTITQPRRANGTLAALPADLYRQNIEARLLNNSERVGACLLWRGRLTYSGYGHISVYNEQKNVHRVAYDLWVGPIPAGLEVDHLCRVRNCFEPSHLEPVTHQENLRRIHAGRTHCVHGHEHATHGYLSPVNGRRVCRTCKRAQRTNKKGQSL